MLGHVIAHVQWVKAEKVGEAAPVEDVDGNPYGDDAVAVVPMVNDELFT